MSDQTEKEFCEAWLVEQFSSKQGERVVKYLRQIYAVDQPVVVSGASELVTGARDGARIPILQLCALIEKHKQPKPRQTKQKRK